MSAFATTIDRARAELAANPRLRLGVWLIVGILAGYFAFVIQADRVDAIATDYAVADARLSRGRDLLARQDWAERLAAARATETNLQGRFWRAANEGLAQARLRNVVDELMAKLYLAQPRADLGLSRALPDVPRLWQVQARIYGQGRTPSILRLLHRIANHPNKIVVERVELTRGDGSIQVDLLISGYFLIDERRDGIPGAEG